MRKHIVETSELKEQLKEELERFKTLNEEKQVMWSVLGDSEIGRGEFTAKYQEYELLKAKWTDSAQEISHIHRKLYPYFPRRGTCYNCGADTLPVLGSQANLTACIACETMTDNWSL